MFSLNDVTILLLSRNHEKFIEECIHSINREFGNEIQLLNLDIGSIDGTLGISKSLCNEFGMDAVHLKLDKNTKTLTALKSLEEYVSTTYVILLSADDALGENYRQTLNKLFSDITEHTVINFPSMVTDHNLHPLYLRVPKWSVSSKKNKKLLSYSNPGTAPGAVIPWKMLVETQSWKQSPDIIIEDYWLWWQFIDIAPFITSQESHVLYRQHQHNISKASRNKAYAYSLGYVSALPTYKSNNYKNRLLSLVLIPRWLRHLNIAVWRNYILGYQDSKQSELNR